MPSRLAPIRAGRDFPRHADAARTDPGRPRRARRPPVLIGAAPEQERSLTMNSTGLPGAALKAAGLAAGAALLLLAFAANIMLGYTRVSLDDAWAAVTRYDETSMSQAVIRLTRLPRALIAAAVGASLAVAGVIMQAITRNPLASPSILGINSGAALAVVFALTVLRIESQTGLAWAAFGGAAAAAALVYGLSALGSDSLSPLRIVLAGAAMSALFASGTQGLLVRNQASLQDVLFWLSGSIAGRPLGILAAVAPYMLASMLAAWLLARHSTCSPPARRRPRASACASRSSSSRAAPRSCCSQAAPSPSPGRSASSASSFRSSPASFPAWTTAGWCRTACCSARCCCWSPTSPPAT